MSVVILGGNECMERRYIDLCKSYSCLSLSGKGGDKDLRRIEKQAGQPRPDDLFHQHHVPQAGAGRAERDEGRGYHYRAVPHQLAVSFAGDSGKVRAAAGVIDTDSTAASLRNDEFSSKRKEAVIYLGKSY